MTPDSPKAQHAEVTHAIHEALYIARGFILANLESRGSEIDYPPTDHLAIGKIDAALEKLQLLADRDAERDRAVRLNTLREVFNYWDREGIEGGDVWDWILDELEAQSGRS